MGGTRIRKKKKWRIHFYPIERNWIIAKCCTLIKLVTNIRDLGIINTKKWRKKWMDKKTWEVALRRSYTQSWEWHKIELD